jgi:ribosomal protein S18 acetylase RimI-like enzyme
MSHSITIRKGVPADQDKIVEFNLAMAAETENRVLDRSVLNAGVQAVFNDEQNGFYLVAQRQGRVVGGLLITREWSDWRNGPFWWIQSVYVEPDSRRQGVYRALYAHVLDRARAAGACGIRLYVEHENRRAQQTYAALGMSESAYAMREVEL